MIFLTVLNENQNTPQDVLLESLVDGSIWKRTGYCNQCGACCSDTENVFQTHDGNHQPIEQPLEQVVPGKCAYFRWDENNLGVCTGRDTMFYQTGCKWMPSKIGHVQQQYWENCTYHFEKISDGS
jgi:hypothetical protein